MSRLPVRAVSARPSAPYAAAYSDEALLLINSSEKERPQQRVSTKSMPTRLSLQRGQSPFAIF